MLLLVFRALVSAAIPIALAIVAVATAFILLFIVAGFTDVNTITPLLVSMIGLGVGIDYSLFIVTRFRQLLHDGLSPADAAAEAGASAGRATLFAGLTVAISVSGLAFFGLDFVTKLGVGSALGVLTTVLMANSLLIAVLAKLGHRVHRMSAGFHVLLYVVTLGFYGWYWAYRAQRGTRRRTGEGVGGPFGLLIWIVIPAVSAFLIPSQVRRAYEKAGRDAPVRGWTGLWLFPFGILIVPAIVWFVKVQRALEGLEVAAAVAPIDDSEAARERTLIARWGRFVTRHHKPVFVVLLAAGLVLAAGSALVRLGASDQGTQPDGADGPAGVRPACGGLRPRLQRPDPDRHRREWR